MVLWENGIFGTKFLKYKPAKMKTKLSLLILTSFLFLSFMSIKTNDDEKLKNKLTGTWSGFEEDNQKIGRAHV